MFESKLYQNPEGFIYHLYTAQNGVLTVSTIKSGKGVIASKGFENLYEAKLYLQSKRADVLAE
jgi:hypothetical protein